MNKTPLIKSDSSLIKPHPKQTGISLFLQLLISTFSKRYRICMSHDIMKFPFETWGSVSEQNSSVASYSCNCRTGRSKSNPGFEKENKEYSQRFYVLFFEKIPKVSIRDSKIKWTKFFENEGWTRIDFMFYMNGSSILCCVHRNYQINSDGTSVAKNY